MMTGAILVYVALWVAGFLTLTRAPAYAYLRARAWEDGAGNWRDDV